jgi:hypothetical protein
MVNLGNFTKKSLSIFLLSDQSFDTNFSTLLLSKIGNIYDLLIFFEKGTPLPQLLSMLM